MAFERLLVIIASHVVESTVSESVQRPWT